MALISWRCGARETSNGKYLVVNRVLSILCLNWYFLAESRLDPLSDIDNGGSRHGFI